MNEKRYDTILFDLDGTLLNTLDDLTDSMNYALSQSGFPWKSKAEIRSFLGNGINRLMELSIPDGKNNPNFNSICNIFKDHYALNCNNKTKPYPGIMNLLNDLNSQGFKMAIISNKMDSAVQELNQLYFQKFIPVAVGEREGIRRKPAPDAVEEAIKRLGSVKEKTVYVGDSEVDMATAKNAGIDYIIVDWGFRDREFLIQKEAKRIVSGPSQILSIADGSRSVDWGKVIVGEDHPEEFLKQMKPFAQLMMRYRCSLMEIETKFKVLNEEFSLQYNRNPFESIKTRIKKPLSIMRKLQKKGLPLTSEGIEENLNDIAGVRVICSFPEDIYILADLLTKQDDVILVEKKDYIKNPKENGYRSLHLIVDIPIFLSDEKHHMKVEVQFRTIAMDFWASLEHKLKYKKDIENPEAIAIELKRCSDLISNMDYEMQGIRHMIDSSQRKKDKNMNEIS